MNDEMDLFLKVERGELTAEAAARLMEERHQSISSTDYPIPAVISEPAPEIEFNQQKRDAEIRRFGSFTRWWLIPFIFGVFITALGAFWMDLGWNNGDILFGFWLAWFPFVLGIILMALSWRARASHWIHMHIKQGVGRHPQNIALSFPLPFGIVKWANRTFGHRFPAEVRGIDLDDLIDSIEESVTSDNPIYLWVDDEKEQQQVEIWIERGAETGL